MDSAECTMIKCKILMNFFLKREKIVMSQMEHFKEKNIDKAA